MKSVWATLPFICIVFFAQAECCEASPNGDPPASGATDRLDRATTASHPPSVEPDSPTVEGKELDLCGHARKLHNQFETRQNGPGSPREGDDQTDVTHYFLDIEVIPEYDGPDVDAVRVEGVGTVDVMSTVDGLTMFTLDLRSTMTVNSVTGDMTGWTRVGDTIEITLNQTYNTGEAFQVVVDYVGYPQTGGFGAFKWWTRGDDLVVATLSEPWYAKYWWPCKDALDDKATMQMHCTVPDEFVVVSNGLDDGTELLAGDRIKYKWHETYPMIPYLASLAITNYKCYDQVYEYGGAESMPVPSFIYPDHWDYGLDEPLPDYKTGCDELPDMLDKLGVRYGLYPFINEKYGVVETGGTGGIGASMEHQTISSMSRVENYSDIMLHELAHQWWGDNVTCDTWYDIWLNEGFASYSEAVYRELKAGGGFSSYMNRMNNRRPGNPDAQVYRTNIGSTGAIFSTNAVYNKGAWVLHMLRHVMGDDPFFDALGDYRTTYEDDSATTAEFTASVSASFGRDLGWFTDQWVMNPGSPDYECAWLPDQVGAQHYLLLEITQTQDDRGYEWFTMPVDVEVTTGSGTATYVVWSMNEVDAFAIPVDGEPTAVELDPDPQRTSTLWILTYDDVDYVSPSGISAFCQGDLNEDGGVNGLDIQSFVDAVFETETWPVAWQRADMDFDGRCDVDDLPLFVNALLGLSECPGE